MHTQPDTAEELWLLGMVGMSPAILTETVWALAHQPNPQIPSRIIVITTARGRHEVEKSLFTPLIRFDNKTAWQTLRDALTHAGHDLKNKLRFGLTGDDIRIITQPDPSTGLSKELADIRTPEENDSAADFILEQVRGIVQNPDVDLVGSVAGGRKTMGALLYGSMTLAARETDRLTHVLVSEPFETLRDFYFPTQPGGPLSSASGHLHDPATAHIELADIPFVPLRNLFLKDLQRPVGNFRTLVDLCRSGIRRRVGEELRVEISLRRPLLTVNNASLDTTAREHLVLVVLARRAKENAHALSNYKDAAEAVSSGRTELIEPHRHSPSLRSSHWSTELAHAEINEEFIRKTVSSLRTKLRQRGAPLSDLTSCLPTRGRFSLEIPGPMIHLKE